MAKNKLGVDIDGVLNSLYLPLAKLVKKYFKLKVDMSHYDMYDQIGLTETEWHKFLDEHYDEMTINAEDKCQYYLQQLKNDYDIYIITARPYEFAQTTIQWLKDQNIYYDDILFKSGNKVDACKFVNVKYMIDDSPWNIHALNREKINCLIFDRPYNQTVKDTEFIQRVYNWNDIFTICNKQGGLSK